MSKQQVTHRSPPSLLLLFTLPPPTTIVRFGTTCVPWAQCALRASAAGGGGVLCENVGTWNAKQAARRNSSAQKVQTKHADSFKQDECTRKLRARIQSFVKTCYCW